MIEERRKEKVVICDKCGAVISWSIDSNIKHGYVCTSCIDKDFGKYRVLDLHRFELERLGAKPDKLTDETMSLIAGELAASLLIGDYWVVLQELFAKYNDILV